MPAKILIVEDDEFIRDGLCLLLQKEGYTTESAGSIKPAGEYLGNGKYDLIILDNMLPDGFGTDFCRSIRENGNSTPVIFLTACDDENQIVQGLDAGADDYVTKPFKIRELLSRVRAILRRSASTVISSKGISIDTANMSIRNNGETVFTTPTEFQIISILIRNAGIIVTRESLLSSIWDNNGNFIDDNTLSVHISRLREKIGSEHISTIRGVGYRWEE